MAFWALIAIAIAIVTAVVSFALTPKPKTAKPPASQDLEAPTADAGRPIPVVFGTMTVKGLNVLHSTNRGKQDYKVKV